MFIRVHDDVKITTEHKDLTFSKGKRKGNTFKKFRITPDETIEYGSDVLVSRMIPKDKIDVMNQDIKVLVMGNDSILVFQEFNEEPIHFLAHNDLDELDLLHFSDLVPDHTEIFCYDPTIEDYFFNKVSNMFIISKNGTSDKKTLRFFNSELKKLSRYIIGTNPKDGIILNGIMII